MDPNEVSLAAADPLDVVSTVGTWVAAGIAVIALVGIIAPWAALRTARSVRSRAMTAIDDVPGRYVSHGLRISNLRIFRRIRIPDLAKTYHTNKPNVAILVRGDAATKPVETKFPTYANWNTGWAQFAALCESYYLPAPRERDKKPLLKPRGGTLEVVQSRAVIVVDKRWVYLIGLLGRYGSDLARLTAGAADQPPRERGAEAFDRVSLAGSNTGAGADATAAGQRDSDSLSNISESVVPSDDFGAADEQKGQDAAAGRPDRYRAVRGRHGEWELSSSARPEIRGLTGTFRSLGRQDGTWHEQSLVAFIPRTRSSMAECLGARVKIRRKSEATSLEVMFLLAHGLLRGRSTAPLVWSVQDPVSDGSQSQLRHFMTESGRARRQPAHTKLALQSTANLPSWLSISALSVNVKIDAQYRWSAYESVDTEPHKWRTTTWTPPGGTQTEVKLRLKDLSKILGMFFSTEWDEWGYLIPKSRCDIWANILEPVMLFVRNGNSVFETKITDFLNITWIKRYQRGQFTECGALDWKWEDRGFCALKTKELVAFENSVKSLITEDGEKLRIPIAILLATSDDLRQSVLASLLAPNPAPQGIQQAAADEEARLAGGTQAPNPAQNDPPEDIQPQGDQAYQMGDLHQPVLPAPQHDVGSGTQVIEDWRAGVPAHEANENDRASSVEGPTNNLAGRRRRCDRFRFSRQDNIGEANITTLRLTWVSEDIARREGEEAMTEVEQWSDIQMVEAAAQETHVHTDDLILIAIWAATRCALWRSSADSTPLSKFVINLDRHIWLI